MHMLTLHVWQSGALGTVVFTVSSDNEIFLTTKMGEHKELF
jgi:hypothetical protein